MEFKTKPMQHQLEYLERTVNKPYVGLAWDMGTGKSKEVIDWSRYKFYKHGRVLRTLIVAPPIALLNWRDEWKKHSSCEPYVTVLNQKSSAKRIKTLKAGLNSGRCIVVVNYEGLKGLEKTLSPIDWELVIADESHKIKNPDAKTTDYFLRITASAKYRACLSGTPMPNGPIDIWTQTYFLDRGVAFGTSFTAFRSKYFYNALEKAKDKDGNPVKFKRFVPYKSALPELQAKINLVWDRVLKKDCLDLPDKQYVPILLEMEPEQRKMHTELVKDSISILEDGAVLADSAGKALIRLRQVSSGFYVNDETKEIHRFKKNPKVEACKEILEGCTSKVIIWATFRDNIFQLLHELRKYKPASIFGDTADKYKEQQRFNTDPECRVIVCNPQSAATAINLVAADTTIYFSQSHDFEHRSQSEARNYRNGSQIHEKVTYYDLMYEKSVDPMIMNALQSKEELNDILLSDNGISLLKGML